MHLGHSLIEIYFIYLLPAPRWAIFDHLLNNKYNAILFVTHNH